MPATIDGGSPTHQQETNPPQHNKSMMDDHDSHDDEHSGGGSHHEGGGGGGGGSGGGRRRTSGGKGVRGGGRRLSANLTSAASGLDATTCLLLPAARIGGVIGRGGDVIKGIRDLTGTRIHITAASEDDRDPNFRLVTVSGTVQEVCSAVELICKQAGLFDGHREEEGDYIPKGMRMVIEGTCAGQLIGKKGATINDIRTQSGARVQVLGEDESIDEGALDGERVVILLGEAEPCRVAHKLICSVMAATYAAQANNNSANSPGGMTLPTQSGGSSSFFSGGETTADPPYRAHHSPSAMDEGEEGFDEDTCEVIMRVPNEKIGRVIGQGGSVINQIRTESGCRIDIENTRSGDQVRFIHSSSVLLERALHLYVLEQLM